MHRLTEAIAALIIFLPLAASAASPAKTDGSESLGNKLLEDLTPSTAEKGGAGPASSAIPTFGRVAREASGSFVAAGARPTKNAKCQHAFDPTGHAFPIRQFEAR